MIMRKLFVLICVLLTGFSALQAQRPSASIFKGGVRAGIATSQISGDNLSGFHKLGATAGLYAAVPLIPDADNLHLQMELDFTMKGSHSFNKSKVNVTGKYVLNLGYLEIPVLLRWRFAHITIYGNSGFELEVGPMLGVNIYARERDIYGIIPGRPQFSRLELSAVAGLSYRFNEHHGVNFRFSNSILKVRTPNWAVNRPILKQYNTVLSLNYFYQF